MLDVIADFWKPVKKVQPQEKLHEEQLQIGSSIGFGFVPQALLSGRRLTVSAINTYQFGAENLTSYVLSQDREPSVSMIIADTEGEQYLAISRRIPLEERGRLFDNNDLEGSISNPDATRLACKDNVLDFKGWLVSSYKREIHGMKGRLYKGDHRRLPLPATSEGQDFAYTLLVSDSNEHALEIEKYNDGRVEVYATIYRRINDVGEISHPVGELVMRPEATKPDLKLASKRDDVASGATALLEPVVVPKPIEAKPAEVKVEAKAPEAAKPAEVKVEEPKAEVKTEAPKPQAAAAPLSVQGAQFAVQPESKVVLTPVPAAEVKAPEVKAEAPKVEVKAETAPVEVKPAAAVAALIEPKVEAKPVETKPAEIKPVEVKAAEVKTEAPKAEVKAEAAPVVAAVPAPQAAAPEKAVEKPEEKPADKVIEKIVAAQNAAPLAPTKPETVVATVLATEPSKEKDTMPTTEAAAVNGANNSAGHDATKPTLYVHSNNQESTQSVRAISRPQGALDNDSIECDLRVANKLIDEAIRNEMRLNDVVRRVIELPVANPESVQIPVTLTDEDYALLAIRYSIPSSDRNAIKRRIIEELNDFSGEKKA